MRRFRELEQRGTPESYEKVLEEMRQRDYNDSHRAAAPLKQAEDAVLLDTTELDFAAAVRKRCCGSSARGRADEREAYNAALWAVFSI